jgi:hypothetical protein
LPNEIGDGLARHTIHMYGNLYSHAQRMAGYHQSWIGKSFEYAVADFFNRRFEPFWTLIRTGIDRAVSIHRSSRVRVVDIDIDRLSCIRVCKECQDSREIIREFRAFRILRDARTTLESAAKRYPGLEAKVDVLFCERESDGPRFTVTASLKVNRQSFLTESVRRDFTALPLDLGITVGTPRFLGTDFEKKIGTQIVYLPMNVPGIEAWENATAIVKNALVVRKKPWLIRWALRMFRRYTPGHYWVEFLADRLDNEIDQVVDDIRANLSEKPLMRTAQLPVLLGPVDDVAQEFVT